MRFCMYNKTDYDPMTIYWIVKAEQDFTALLSTCDIAFMIKGLWPSGVIGTLISRSKTLLLLFYVLLSLRVYHAISWNNANLIHTNIRSLYERCCQYYANLFTVYVTHFSLDKWSPFRRRNFQMSFREWKFLYFLYGCNVKTTLAA